MAGRRDSENAFKWMECMWYTLWSLVFQRLRKWNQEWSGLGCTAGRDGRKQQGDIKTFLSILQFCLIFFLPPTQNKVRSFSWSLCFHI